MRHEHRFLRSLPAHLSIRVLPIRIVVPAKKSRGSRGRHVTALAWLFTILSLAPLHAADACQTIASASRKIWEVPVHIYMNQTYSFSAIPAKLSESIYVGGALYVVVRGKWTRSPITIAQLKSDQEEGKNDAPKATCRYVRDEAVDGEPAAVYSTHKEGDGFQSDLILWVSKSRNVPLRSESDMDTGVAGKSNVKSHASMRYDYKNVQAPAGVN